MAVRQLVSQVQVPLSRESFGRSPEVYLSSAQPVASSSSSLAGVSRLSYDPFRSSPSTSSSRSPSLSALGGGDDRAFGQRVMSCAHSATARVGLCVGTGGSLLGRDGFLPVRLARRAGHGGEAGLAFGRPSRRRRVESWLPPWAKKKLAVKEGSGRSKGVVVSVTSTSTPRTVETDGTGEGQEGNSPLLSDIQVQSQEEQEKLWATPVHGAALQAMYASYFASCFVEHTWRFAWPALLAIMYDSLMPVAVVSFVGQLVIFLAGPWVGELMDRAPRVPAFVWLNVVQTCSMLLSAAVTIYALQQNCAATCPAGLLLVTQPWFAGLIVASALERMTGLASGVAFERDWVVQLAGPNRPVALANANAILRRVDLLCEICGPFAFGVLLTTLSPISCINLAAVAMAAFLPVLIVLVRLTDKLSKGVLHRAKPAIPKVAEVRPHQGQMAEEHEHGQVPGGLDSVLKGWKLYLSQAVLPASLAYVLLSLNAVLGPYGLMTTFLTQQGMDASLIGLFRGSCAAMGFAATFLSSTLIAKFGLIKTGGGALVFMAATLTLSVLVFVAGPAGTTGALGISVFLGLIVLSRLGHWVYDVVDAQIFQTAIPAQQATLVGTTEMAMASLAELVMLGVAIVFDDVRHFGMLAGLSTVAVIAAAILYILWLKTASSETQLLLRQLDNSSGLGTRMLDDFDGSDEVIGGQPVLTGPLDKLKK